MSDKGLCIDSEKYVICVVSELKKNGEKLDFEHWRRELIAYFNDKNAIPQNGSNFLLYGLEKIPFLDEKIKKTIEDAVKKQRGKEKLEPDLIAHLKELINGINYTPPDGILDDLLKGVSINDIVRRFSSHKTKEYFLEILKQQKIKLGENESSILHEKYFDGSLDENDYAILAKKSSLESDLKHRIRALKNSLKLKVDYLYQLSKLLYQIDLPWETYNRRYQKNSDAQAKTELDELDKKCINEAKRFKEELSFNERPTRGILCNKLLDINAAINPADHNSINNGAAPSPTVQDDGNQIIKQAVKNLKNDIQSLSNIFENFYKNEKNTILQLAAEYLLEEIGQRSKIFLTYPLYQEETRLTLTNRYFNLLVTARKVMAHFPIAISSDLMNYYIERLVLETQFELKDNVEKSTSLDNSNTMHVPRLITVEDLIDNRLLLDLYVARYGFKPDYKIFHRNFNTDIGIQGDLNLLVEPVSSTYRLFELELHLSDAFNANVRVFTRRTLRKRYENKISSYYYKNIVNEAQTLGDLRRSQDFIRIFREQRWAKVRIPNNGEILVSDHQRRKALEFILSFIAKREIYEEKEALDLINNTNNLHEMICHSLDVNNHHNDKIQQWIDNMMTWIVNPHVISYEAIQIFIGSESSHPIIKEDLSQGLWPIHYPAFIVPETRYNSENSRHWRVNYSSNIYQVQPREVLNSVCFEAMTMYSDFFQGAPKLIEYLKEEKILSIEELWRFNNEAYKKYPDYFSWSEKFKSHNMLEGWGIIVRHEQNGDLIIHHQGCFLRLTKQEFELIYVKHPLLGHCSYNLTIAQLQKNLASDINVFNIEMISRYFAIILISYKERLSNIFRSTPFINATIFSHAIDVEYALTREDLLLENKKSQDFAQQRFRKNSMALDVLTEKAMQYFECVQIKLKDIPTDIKILALDMLAYILQLDHLLDNYYKKNEFSITYNANSQDDKQKNITRALGVTLIANKIEFRREILSNHQLRSNLEIYEEFYKLYEKLTKRLKFIERYSCDFDLKLINALEIIFDQVTNPFILRRFVSEPEIAKQALIENLIERYGDRTDCGYIIELPSGERRQQYNFNEEIEFAIEKKRETLKKIILSQASSIILRKIFQNDITIVDLDWVGTYDPSDIYQPVINGILGFYSELDRELSSIHEQISIKKIRRIFNEPAIVLENSVETAVLRLANETFPISNTIATIKYNEFLGNMEELLSFHDWPDDKKREYRSQQSFQDDQQKINDYYEFRSCLEKLNSCTHRIKECEQQISLLEQRLNEIQEKALSHEITGVKNKLSLFKEWLDKDNKNIVELNNQILNSNFTKQRVIKLLQLCEWDKYSGLDDATVLPLVKGRMKNIKAAIQAELTQYVETHLVNSRISMSQSSSSSKSSSMTNQPFLPSRSPKDPIKKFADDNNFTVKSVA
ncbi:MAG: hypothetical protein WC756_20225 [Taibaiella sp.]